MANCRTHPLSTQFKFLKSTLWAFACLWAPSLTQCQEEVTVLRTLLSFLFQKQCHVNTLKEYHQITKKMEIFCVLKGEQKVCDMFRAEHV